MREGLKDIDVVMMLRLQNERMNGALLPSAQEFYKSYGLTPEKLAVAKPDAIVLHPGPMNRGVEIDSSVADGKQSVILPQVTFGIAIRMAVMSMLAGSRKKQCVDEDPHQGRPAHRPEARHGRREGRLRRRRQGGRHRRDACRLLRQPRAGRGGAHRLPGTRRPRRAPARARPGVPGDPRIGDGRRRCGRGDQPRLPARYRSASRRAGTRADAEVPRQEPESGAGLPDRRVDRGAEGRAADRDGRARRSGLRGLLSGRCASRRQSGAVPRAAVRRDLRVSGMAAPAGRGPRARRRRARRPGGDPPRPARDSRCAPRRSPCRPC